MNGTWHLHIRTTNKKPTAEQQREQHKAALLQACTEKSSDGYIIVEWQKKIPECFMQKLYEDQDIIDFLFYDPNLQAVEVPQGE